jgi:chromosome segregation ATPase
LPGLAHQGQLTHQPGQQQQGQANQQQNLRLREHYERQYLEKRREKERVQGEMRGVDRNLRDYMRQRATLQRELRQTRTHPELRGGIQIHLRDVNNRIQRIRTEMNRYKQRLRSLDSEMRALTSKMPRR